MKTPTKIVNKTDDHVTKSHLDEVLFYDMETGIFYARRNGSKRKSGNPVGGVRGDGYLRINLTCNGKSKNYPAHRLAWLHVYGYMPDSIIDHINGNKLDNRIENLRISDCSKNAINTKRIKHEGLYQDGIGASFHKARGMWRASIRRNGKCHHIGHFNEKDDALMAYMFASELQCIVRKGKIVSIV